MERVTGVFNCTFLRAIIDWCALICVFIKADMIWYNRHSCLSLLHLTRKLHHSLDRLVFAAENICNLFCVDVIDGENSFVGSHKLAFSFPSNFTKNFRFLPVSFCCEISCFFSFRELFPAIMGREFGQEMSKHILLSTKTKLAASAAERLTKVTLSSSMPS